MAPMHDGAAAREFAVTLSVTILVSAIQPAGPDRDDPMDGDAASALASAGMGTDEDYGCFGGDCEDW